jgi:hypothetical protein
MKDHIYISLRGEVWVHTLTRSLFIEVPVARQESEWSCVCVLGCKFCLCFYDVLPV